jgi:hypothetical protein
MKAVISECQTEEKEVPMRILPRFLRRNALRRASAVVAPLAALLVPVAASADRASDRSSIANTVLIANAAGASTTEIIGFTDVHAATSDAVNAVDVRHSVLAVTPTTPTALASSAAATALAAHTVLVYFPPQGPGRPPRWARKQAIWPGSGDREPTRAAPSEPAQGATGQGQLYVAPELGSLLARVGSASRGTGRQATLLPLAPDHLALTMAEQPTLYWFLAEPKSTRVHLTLRDELLAEPLLEAQLPSPAAAGIHAFRLSEHGVKLGTDRNYQWVVSLVPDPEQRSQDFAVGAWIRRSDPAPALRNRLADAPGAGAALVYAQHGVWYDAIAALCSQIDATPEDPTLREQRAALLDQVGLSEVAAYDRRGLP